MVDRKLVTIIVPTYNVERYVGQCLSSLVKQTLINHSVIVVDDGSTDAHTSEICKSFAQQFPDIITYVRQENQGLGAARNTGLSMVDTDYVGFLDSDDWITPNYIERLTEELENYSSENIDIVFTLPVIYDSLTCEHSPWHDQDKFYEIFYSENRIVSTYENRQLYYLEPSACRRIFRTEFLKQHNFSFPVGMKWEDIFPHFYLLYYAKACIGISDIGFHYRINTSGQITSQSGRGRLDIVKVFRDVFLFAQNESCDWETVKSMIYMLNSYAKWSLDMSDISTRPELVKALSVFYRSLPNSYFKKYFKERYNYKKERAFVWAIKKNRFRLLFCDYLPEELALNVINKLRRKP